VLVHLRCYSYYVINIINVDAVFSCLTPKEAQRPDIVGVAAHIADVLLTHLDCVQQESVQLEKKLERACKRTQKYVISTTNV